jgi:hypothetical protein
MHNSTPRLGTAQPFVLLCAFAPLRESLSALLVAFFITTSLAQEDVAETKSNLVIDTTPITEAPITDAERSHWAFAPIRRPALPVLRAPHSELRTCIDSFILSKLAAKNLTPAPEADRATLLRRVSFDLTGLPPTPADLVAFEIDTSPDAYERLVDRLLASPAFGERYGQYWLDLARFAETDGFEHDYVRPQAWRYRDWVIAALNIDMPYDDFLRLQLAGDEESDKELDRRNSEMLRSIWETRRSEPSAAEKTKSKKPSAPEPTFSQIPTTFCLAGPDMPDVNDQVERRHNLLNELTGTVGAALLGLQMGCAQCHDHKYDPISQADFYRLRAIFEPSLPELKRDQPNNILTNQFFPITARFYVRGNHKRPGLEVQPAFPRIADSALRTPHSAPGTTRSARTELAEWLVSPTNPLTSRVIANRLWQWHFGRGLCETPSDFGVMGGLVTHPELLDWLASELRETGWSMKRLHRTILSSATYRQASAIADLKLQNAKSSDVSDNLQFAITNLQSQDPDNTLYSHFPRQRLSGEAIRDAMLAAAGLLTSERGGPGVMPPLPEELLSTLLKNQWSASKREADHYRRSIYVFARRNLRYPIFEAFDRPDGNATCPLRGRSTTAPQSLLLFNSEFSLLAAQHLAGRVLSAEEPKNQRTEELKQQIERLYLIALSRRPTAEEEAALEKFFSRQQSRLAAESRPRAELALPIPCPDTADPNSAAALVDACLALLNTNEFIYVD